MKTTSSIAVSLVASRALTLCSEELRGPLTVKLYRELVAEALDLERLAPVFVQFRRGGVVDCARVVECKAGDAGPDWYRLEAGAGPFWVPHNNVRACQGAGRCHCAEERDAARACASSGAPCAVPLGNTGTTTAGVA